MPRRVRRPKDKEYIFKALIEGETDVFETYKDVFMMAACIGYQHDKRVPFDSTAEQIAWTVFSGQTDLPIINAIALDATKDVSILLDDEETFDRKLTIVEEYCNGGLEILKEKLLDSTGNAHDNFMNMIYETREDEKTLTDIDKFVDDLF